MKTFIFKFYNLLWGTYFLRPLLKLLKLKPNRFIKILYKLDSYNDYGKNIFVLKEYDKISLLLNLSLSTQRNYYYKLERRIFVLKDLIKKLNVTNIFDVGAHIGIYSIYLSKCYPDLNIYSFEPSENYKIFKINRFINKCNNIKLYKYAISDQDGVAELYYNKFGDGGHSIEQISNTFKKETVDNITIDTFCKINNIIGNNVIKVDTEGHNINVLLGAYETIKNYTLAIISEYWNIEEKNKIIKLLSDCNFKYFF